MKKSCLLFYIAIIIPNMALADAAIDANNISSISKSQKAENQ